MPPRERLVIKDLQKRRISFDSHKNPPAFFCFDTVWTSRTAFMPACPLHNKSIKHIKLENFPISCFLAGGPLPPEFAVCLIGNTRSIIQPMRQVMSSCRLYRMFHRPQIFYTKSSIPCQDFKVTAISGMKKPLHRAVVKKNKHKEQKNALGNNLGNHRRYRKTFQIKR